MATVEGPRTVKAAEYNQKRTTRLQETVLSTQDFYTLLLRLSGEAHCDALQFPASIQRLQLADIGRTTLDIVLLNADLRPLTANKGSMHDGIWTPNTDDALLFAHPICGYAREGFLLDYDDGINIGALLATKEFALQATG